METTPHTPLKESTPADTVGASTEGASVVFMVSGYVRLHRSMLQWEWYQDEAAKALFLHLLLSVNWKPGRWRGHDVPAGTLITSTVKLAEAMHWNRQKLGRTLDKLKSTGEVSIQTNNHWTAITVVGWDMYQGDGQQTGQPNGQQTGDKRATSGHNRRREERKKEERGLSPSRMNFEEFREACRLVHAERKVLSAADAKAFFDYWTEGHNDGKGRWQTERVFDIALRMSNWKKRIMTNGKGVPSTMTKAEAYAKLEEYRAANGIPPGGVVETHLIPSDIYAALK